MQNLLTRGIDGLDWRHVAASDRTPVLLVRHGRTAHNLEKRFVGASDVPLDEVGQAQAKALGHRLSTLPMSGLYSSPLSRARVTAEALGAPTLVPQLVELNQGALEGLLGPEAFARYPEFFAAWRQDPAHVRVPGGETLHECQQRSLLAVRALTSRVPPGPPVVIVAHQMVLATVILHAVGLPLRFVHMVKQGNTAVNLLSVGDQGDLAVHRLNDCEHLPDDQRGSTYSRASSASASTSSRASGTT